MKTSMKLINLVLLTIAVSIPYTLSPDPCRSASSPMFRVNSQRSGTIAEQATPALILKWTNKIYGGIVSSPIVYKGTVYCGARDGSLWAWNAYTGESLWDSPTSGWVDATPCVSSFTVYFPSLDKSVYAVDRRNGELIWHTDTGAESCSSPVIYNGKLYIVGGYPQKKAFVVDINNGNISASYDIGQFGYSSPAIKNNLMFFGTTDGKFHCIDLASGQDKWPPKPTKGGIHLITMAAGDSTVYAVSDGDERKLFCLDQETGSVIWESLELDNQTSAASSVSLSEDKVFVASSVGNKLKLFAFPLLGTTTSWVSDIGTPHNSGIISSPAIASDTVYIGSGDGCLYAIDTETGKYREPATGDLKDTATGYFLSSSGIVDSPCISNGWVYVGTFDGTMWAFEAQNITAISGPDTGDYVVSQASIAVVLTNSSTVQYLLEYSSGTSWVPIASGLTNVTTGSLYLWDTSPLADGDYDLRLTVDGNSVRRAVNRVNVDNPCEPPANVKASDTPFDTGGKITLTWTKSVDDGNGDGDITNYKIYKSISPGNFQLLVQLEKGNIVYLDENCPAGTTYYYVMTSLDARSESQYSNVTLAYSKDNSISTGTIHGPPLPPANLTASDTPDDGGGSITLAWSKSPDDGSGDNDVAGYSLYKSTHNGGFTAKLTQINAGTTFYTDTDCPVYTTYYYTLTAFDLQPEESTHSNATAGYSEMNGVEITPETGGTVTLNFNGTTTEVVIEPGTFETRVRIAIRIPASYPDNGIPSSANATQSVRELLVIPATAKFLKPVIVKIPYSTLETLNMKPENLRIYWYDEIRAAWRVVNTSELHANESRVWASIPHFSLYRIMEYVPGREELLSGAYVYTYPNPAQGDKVTFKYYLGDKADVAIDVYNVAGELIAHLEKTDNPAGIASEIPWNTAGIASGVYVYRIEAKSASGSKAIKKKLAIIH